MKKAMVLLVLLTLLPVAARAEGFLGFLFGGGSSGPTLRFVPVDEAAFRTENERLVNRLIGASEDGNMLLMVNVYELFLWDQTAHRRVPLTFSREEDREALTSLLPMAVLTSGIPGKRDQEALEKLTALVEEFLQKQGSTAIENLDQFTGFRPQIISLGAQCMGLSGNWALVSLNQASCALAIDLRTGESLVFFQDMVPRSFCDGRILFDDGVLDLESGELTGLERLGLVPAPEDGRPELSFLPNNRTICRDGSLLAFGQEGAFDVEGNDFWLLDVTTTDNKVSRIGHFDFTHVPARIMTTGEDRWLLLCQPGISYSFPFFVLDRETGALTEYEPRKMLPVAPAENGVLCFDLTTYDLLLLDPATGGKTKVGLGSGFDWSALTDISGISGLVSGGDGRLFATSLFRPSRDADAISVHGYFVLEGE